MKVPFVIISILFIAFVSFPKIVYADLIDPDYYTKTCNPGEIEIECRYSSKIPFGPKIVDECAPYEKNPSYRYLIGEGHTFGGKEKFCFRSLSVSILMVYHLKLFLPLFLITLLVEIPIFLISISKTRRTVFTIIFVNLFSLSLLYIATLFLPSLLWQSLPVRSFIAVLVLELIVIVFEAILIKFMVREIAFRKILIYSLFANMASLFLGTIVFTLLLG